MTRETKKQGYPTPPAVVFTGEPFPHPAHVISYNHGDLPENKMAALRGCPSQDSATDSLCASRVREAVARAIKVTADHAWNIASGRCDPAICLAIEALSDDPEKLAALVAEILG